MLTDTPTPQTPPPARSSPFVGIWLWSVLLLLTILAAWYGLVYWRRLSPLVLPLPTAVAFTLWQNGYDGFFWPHLWITMQEILLGFLGGSLLGVGLGSLMALAPRAQRVLHPYIIASQAMPKLALAPLFVLWCGFGILPKVLIAALIAFFPLFENTVAGLQAVDAEARDLFRMLGANRWQVFTTLLLPSAVPYVFAGLRVAMVLSVVGAVVGEYVGANKGLGALIMASQGMMDTTLMFAVFILLTLIGIMLYQLVIYAERAVLARRARIVPLQQLLRGLEKG
ncbi:MAG: ABC transporter permease [Candidatus Tectomicrobia bacterium]|uniref:ABC transporter permease n=1 Tax=Tectimicrobiota bacterium TaxID=2528274 RepID=A0A938B390_UNCTE|nr:ABC transporter permease [Candidatus Tectomicrobia bacterium]